MQDKNKMASICLMIYKSNPRIDGTFPIVLRVIQSRKPFYHYTGYFIKEEFWDQENQQVTKNYPNSVRLNHLIMNKKVELAGILMQADLEKRDLPNRILHKKIKNNNKSSFKTTAEEHLSDLLKLRKYNQHSGEKPRIKHFIRFLDGQDIPFQQISVSLLKRYMLFLKADLGLNDRSVMNCLVVIRTLFNRAISEEQVESKHYPFGQGKILIRFQETRKVGLSEAEVKKLESLNLKDREGHQNALNVWLTSFYLAGIRISDVIQLKWEDLHDGRLTYIMGKNQKVVSLKLPSKAQAILENYKDRRDFIYVFPYLKDEDQKDPKRLNARTRSVNAMINKRLKEIATEIKLGKKLSMHISRHTFGQIAGDKIAPQALQKLYRHSDLKTTIGYQSNFIHKDVDGALTEVLDF